MIGIEGGGIDRPDVGILGAGGLQRRAMRLGERLEADVAGQGRAECFDVQLSRSGMRRSVKGVAGVLV